MAAFFSGAAAPGTRGHGAAGPARGGRAEEESAWGDARKDGISEPHHTSLAYISH
jgi:hypothetical protein